MKRWVERRIIAGRFCTLHFVRLEHGYGRVRVHGPRGLLGESEGFLERAERGACCEAARRLHK